MTLAKAKQNLTFTQARDRIHSHYRNAIKVLMKKQKKYLETPTSDLKEEIDEMQGYLRGVKKTLSFVEERMADNEFDLTSSA